MPGDCPAIPIRVFDLRKTIAPVLVLRLDQRLRANRDRARECGVYIVDIKIERLRRHQARAFRCLRVRAVCTFWRKHQDQLSAIRHFHMDHGAVVVYAVPPRKTYRLFVEAGADTGIANSQVRGEPRHIGGAGVGHKGFSSSSADGCIVPWRPLAEGAGGFWPRRQVAHARMYRCRERARTKASLRFLLAAGRSSRAPTAAGRSPAMGAPVPQSRLLE